MTEVTPQDFDFDAWLDGAERPARSVTVYQKAGLIADLDALEEKISHVDEDDVDGPSMGGGAAKLRAEYAKLAKQFHDSALTLRIVGHSEDDKREIAKANPDVKTPGKLGLLVLADAIQSPAITAAQLARLEKVVGDAQFARIVEAYHKASGEIPAVSADFLPKRSTQGDGGES